MKLRKAKRFNTVESYAVCACAATTCRCSCGCSSGHLDSSSSFDGKWQDAFDYNYNDADASYNRG